MNSSLIIVQSVNDCEKLNRNKDTDFLVFTPEVMDRLDLCNISYKTIEDFYSAEEYLADIEAFHINTERLLSDLDDVCSPYTNFPYSYSGNALYFVTWMDDLFYLDRLVESIKNKYDDIYLYGVSRPREYACDQLSYSELASRPSSGKGTISFPLENGLERSVSVIFYTLNLKFISEELVSRESGYFLSRFISYYRRLQNYCKRKYVSIKHKTSSIFSQRQVKKNSAILIAQDGYEVESVKKYLTNYTLIHSIPNIRKDLSLMSSSDVESEKVDLILDKFVSKEFKYLHKYAGVVFQSYHREIVGKIDFFVQRVKAELTKTNPKAVLFSMGIRDVFDMVVADTSNKLGMPLVFFQHGGCLLFYKSWYKKYPELNSDITKTFIINSSEEVESARHNGADVRPMGSISRYDKIHEPIVKPTKEILFCTEPYSCTTYRHLLNNSSCVKMHKISHMILSEISDSSLSVDINIHPSGQHDSYNYYSRLRGRYKNTRIVIGEAVEAIFKKYKLIILPYLGTATLTTFLAHKIPVVLFIEEFDKIDISDQAKQDLIDRCYVVRNRSELRNILAKYKEGELPSKWSKDFVDKYVYPVNDGNPGVNIANYIRAL